MEEIEIAEKLDVIINYLELFKTMYMMFLIFLTVVVLYKIVSMMIGGA